MLRLMCVICICLMTFPTFCESASKYQVATITDVKTHQAGGGASDVVSYDVSVKVADTIYVTLYTPPSGENTVKYAAGRELLVLVGEKTQRRLGGLSAGMPVTCQMPATYYIEARNARMAPR